jgi:hypothetical protein
MTSVPTAIEDRRLNGARARMLDESQSLSRLGYNAEYHTENVQLEVRGCSSPSASGRRNE